MSPERTIFKDIETHVQAFLAVRSEFYIKGKVLAKTCVDEFFKEHPEVKEIIFDCWNDYSFNLKFTKDDKVLYPHDFPTDTALGKCVRVLESSLRDLKKSTWVLYDLVCGDVIVLKNPN